MATKPLPVYVVTPISETQFTLQEKTSGKTQDLDLEKLGTTGLYKTLFLFKNKIDAHSLGNLEPFWRDLPMTTTEKPNPKIQAQMSDDSLRNKLRGFLRLWVKQAQERRKLNEIDVEKFKTKPEFETLHTVSNTTPANHMELRVTPFGMQVQPETCAKRVVDVQKQMEVLATLVAQCQAQTAGSEKDACYATVNTNITEMQRNFAKQSTNCVAHS